MERMYRRLGQLMSIDLSLVHYRWRMITAELEKHKVWHTRAGDQDGETWKASRCYKVWTVVPIILLVGFTLRSTVSVFGHLLDCRWIHSPLVRLWLSTELFPTSARFNLEVTFLLYTIFNLVGRVFEVTRKLKHLSFYVILVVEPEGIIKPEMLGLREETFRKFVQLRRLALHLLRWFMLSHFMITFSMYLSAWQFGAFAISVPVSLWQLINFQYWAIMASQCYTYPFLLIVLINYHQLKAQDFRRKLDHLVGGVRRRLLREHSNQRNRSNLLMKMIYLYNYNRVVRGYLDFTREVKKYQRHYWSAYLSIIFIFLQVISTYLVFFSFVQNIPVYFRFVVISLFLACISNLMILTHFCGYIFRINRSVGHSLFRVNAQLQQLRWYRYRPGVLVKLETHSLNIRDHTEGFRLYDGQVINTKTYLQILINISVFFCLIFKNQFTFS